MRVLIAAESFLPQVNGVTNSVLRIAEHLRDNGHQALIIAPWDVAVPKTYAGFPVTTVPAIPFPLYSDVRVGVTPTFVIERIVAQFAPDVLHAAAPLFLGRAALLAATNLNIPSVAIYQTDIPSYAGRYGLGLVETVAWTRVREVHGLANLTLAPSRAARDQLVTHDIPRVEIWGRGVDTITFSPSHRDEALHAQWANQGEVVIGYMGRLAPEKQVDDLTELAQIPGTRLVIVGDGPSRTALQKALPQALFLGRLLNNELATALATMDIFVHPGELETFGQAIQEALASGLAVVAPAKGGPLDLIQPNTGFLYPPGDLAMMRAQVIKLVDDPRLRQRFSTAAGQFTSGRTWPILCAHLVEFYEAAIAWAR
ncbi:MAG: glycosyltransferase family 1 protein [Propionibacteriaceae bacterium]|nr:glycosyltransferase family 1 protein [Propionibacteriaceae bacterium]